MKLKTRTPKFGTRFAKRGLAGFTLAEVLAAMVFLAIVIPVALEGLSIASRAGDVAQRKALAVRVAERLLNEAVVTQQSTLGMRNGTTQEGPMEFKWTIRNELWKYDAMREISAEVFYTAKGHEYSVLLATLVRPQE